MLSKQDVGWRTAHRILLFRPCLCHSPPPVWRTHAQMSTVRPLFLPPRIAFSLLLSPKPPQKSLLGVGRREDESGKITSYLPRFLVRGSWTIWMWSSCVICTDCPLKTFVIERWWWELRCWHSTWAHVFLWCAWKNPGNGKRWHYKKHGFLKYLIKNTFLLLVYVYPY